MTPYCYIDVPTFFRCKTLFILNFLLFCFPASAVNVIFDTDMGIDDWSAMLVVANHPDIEQLGVTSNGVGEGHCADNMQNIPGLLALSTSADVPFACGNHYPIDGYFAFPAPWRHQTNTLSGVAVPKTDRQPTTIDSVELIHQLLSQQTEQVVLLSAGSLTNIVQWLQKYPEDKSKVSSLVMMGGGGLPLVTLLCQALQGITPTRKPSGLFT